MFRRCSSLDEKYLQLQFISKLSSLFWKSFTIFTVRDRDGTIGKVYRLLPQAGVGVTVYRQVGSVNALTGGHSPRPNSLPGLKMML